MPSLFSWSCKRNYKNGYVWNDLSENDVIYPAEGAEYVLKGSEIIEGCAERFQQLAVSNRKQSPGEKPLPKYGLRTRLRNRGSGDEEEEMRYEEEEEEKRSNSSSYTPHSRCSRGVSTDEMEANKNPKSQSNRTELAAEDSSPPSSSSTLSEKAHNSTSQRFEDCDSGAVSEGIRNSVLLQLIACGGSVPAAKSFRNSTELKHASSGGRKSSSLHKGVLCKTAAAGKSMTAEEDEINYMSENPRFGNLQAEDKEFFSGSIVESMTQSRVVEPVLKKSSSYNEERSMKSELAGAAAAAEKKEKEEKCLQGKCIPMKRCSYRSNNKKC